MFIETRKIFRRKFPFEFIYKIYIYITLSNYILADPAFKNKKFYHKNIQRCSSKLCRRKRNVITGQGNNDKKCQNMTNLNVY